MTICVVLLSLVSVLADLRPEYPHPNSMVFAANCLEAIRKTAKEWTRKYATGEIKNENNTPGFKDAAESRQIEDEATTLSGDLGKILLRTPSQETL